MRSIRLLAVVTGALVLGSACGGDNGPNTNDPPVAGFTEVCTNLSCVFTDASNDPDGNNTITTRTWDFGDQTPVSNAVNPTHVYAAAGVKSVKLTVTDDQGASNELIKQITVTAAGPVNTPPTASFEVTTGCTAGTPCGFHSTSTDPDAGGSIATATWIFDDGSPDGSGLDVTHTYDAAGTYDVTLNVTDNLGAPGTVTQQIIVAPAASQDCTTSDTVVDCSLTMNGRVTVKFIVVSRACELTGNRLSSTAPVVQTIFFNLCNRTPGEEYTLRDGTGATLVVEAGTPVGIQFNQGTGDPGDPASGDPGIEVTGSYPNWTLNIDDGGNAGVAGEPDFDDAVISVQATLAP